MIFRPDYLRLHGVIAALGRPPVMAATGYGDAAGGGGDRGCGSGCR